MGPDHEAHPSDWGDPRFCRVVLLFKGLRGLEKVEGLTEPYHSGHTSRLRLFELSERPN